MLWNNSFEEATIFRSNCSFARMGGRMATRRLSHLRFNLCAWLIMHALRLTRAHHKRNRAVKMGHGSQIVWLRSKEPQSSLVLVHINARCSFARMGGGRMATRASSTCVLISVHGCSCTRCGSREPIASATDQRWDMFPNCAAEEQGAATLARTRAHSMPVVYAWLTKR